MLTKLAADSGVAAGFRCCCDGGRRRPCRLLASGPRIDAGEPLVFLGDSGTGNSPLLTAGCATVAHHRHLRPPCPPALPRGWSAQRAGGHIRCSGPVTSAGRPPSTWSSGPKYCSRMASVRLLPTGLHPIQIGAAGPIGSALGDSDHVQGGVGQPVAAPVEPHLALDRARPHRNGAVPVNRAKWSVDLNQRCQIFCGAPRSAVVSSGGGRTLRLACRGRPVKLAAA